MVEGRAFLTAGRPLRNTQGRGQLEVVVYGPGNNWPRKASRELLSLEVGRVLLRNKVFVSSHSHPTDYSLISKWKLVSGETRQLSQKVPETDITGRGRQPRPSGCGSLRCRASFVQCFSRKCVNYARSLENIKQTRIGRFIKYLKCIFQVCVKAPLSLGI